MSYKIQTTNRPADADLIEVDDAELIDLLRWGLVVPDKGDIDPDGKLRPKVAKSAPLEVQATTGQVPVIHSNTQGA